MMGAVRRYLKHCLRQGDWRARAAELLHEIIRKRKGHCLFQTGLVHSAHVYRYFPMSLATPRRDARKVREFGLVGKFRQRPIEPQVKKPPLNYVNVKQAIAKDGIATSGKDRKSTRLNSSHLGIS